MSRSTGNPIVDILAMILGEELKREAEPKEEVKKEAPTKTDGFDSLVSEEEYKAILGIKDAVENFIDVHNKCVLSNPSKVVKESSIYARIQYTMLSDIVDDVQDSVRSLYCIHLFNKEAIDEMAEEAGVTVEELEKKIMTQKIMQKLFK